MTGFEKNKKLLFIVATIFLVPLAMALACFMKQKYFDFKAKRASQAELTNLGQVSKKNEVRFTAFIADIEAHTPWKVYITSGHRDFETQMQLYKENPKNAKPGHSKHNAAAAIDINIYQHKGFKTQIYMKVTSKNTWKKTGIVQIARKHGLVWGGAFKGYHDPVHFEIGV